jgi:hypothetical protein
MFWLESGLPNISTRNVVYICRPKMAHMRTIAGHIRASQSTPSSAGPLAFTILLVPRVTELCRKVLEDEGVAGDVTVSEVLSSLSPLVYPYLTRTVQAGIRATGG